MPRDRLDRQGNPMPCRPLHPEDAEKQQWLFDPPPEPPAAPVVPAFSTSADLLSANRKQVAPKREDIKTWSQLKPGYTVWVDGAFGSRPGIVIASLNRTRRQENGGIEILPYCIVRDADNNEEFEVDRLAALRRRKI